MSEENPTPEAVEATPVSAEGQEPTATTAPTPQGEAPVEDDRIKKLNAESARYRTERNEYKTQVQDLSAKYEQIIKGLSTLTGQESEGETDPQKVIDAAIAERDQARAEVKTMKITGDLRAEFSKQNTDPALTLAVLKADGLLDTLDPTADDYPAQVAALVSDVVEKNPRLRTQVVPPSSGQSPTPSDNGQKRITVDDLEKMTPQEIYEAQKAGKLTHLL